MDGDIGRKRFPDRPYPEVPGGHLDPEYFIAAFTSP